MTKKWKKMLKGLIWIGLGLLLADSVYRFGYELITVSSVSMENSIAAGKYVWVNKLIPGPRVLTNNPNWYFRLPGLRKINRNDVIVFNFPDADTILANRPGESYHFLKRQFPDFERLMSSGAWGKTRYLKVTERPRMIKRVLALPGDTLRIASGDIFVNNQSFDEDKDVIRLYRWTGSPEILDRVLHKYEINPFKREGETLLQLTDEQIHSDQDLRLFCKRDLYELNFPDPNIFPFLTSTGWNSDFMGPFYLPRKGDNLPVNSQNIHFYARMISIFEGNHLKVTDLAIYINGQLATSYTFKLNYYWVLGDNRPHSFDSRYWGPVPENHIVGVVNE